MVALSHEAKIKLDELMARAVADGRIPGVVFEAASVERELYANAAGFKNLDGPSSGIVDSNSVFWICSMTKLVTTIATLQLVEQGKIDFNTAVADLVPELSNPIVVDDKSAAQSTYKPAQNPILLKHLLNHTSGLSYVEKKVKEDQTASAYTGVAYEGDHSVEQFFKILRGNYPAVPLEFEPGTNFAYGWNCEIMVIIVERLTGKTIEEYCKEFIFSPLGAQTTYYLTPSVRKDLVPLTFRRKDGNLENWANQLDISEQDPSQLKFCLGGIGLYSTMKDYLLLLRHLLAIQAGRINNGILKSSTVNMLFQPTLEEHATAALTNFTGWPRCQFGLGLCLNREDWLGRRRKGSGFWYGWAGTYYFMDPTTGIAVTYGTQVVPTNDPEVVKLWEELERTLYAGLIA